MGGLYAHFVIIFSISDLAANYFWVEFWWKEFKKFWLSKSTYSTWVPCLNWVMWTSLGWKLPTFLDSSYQNQSRKRFSAKSETQNFGTQNRTQKIKWWNRNYLLYTLRTLISSLKCQELIFAMFQFSPGGYFRDFLQKIHWK